MSTAAAAVGSGEQPAGPPPLPEGTLLQDGRCVVREDAPSFDLLSKASAYNKRGTAGAGRFTAVFQINQMVSGQRCTAAVPVVGLWAAARQLGGLHVVSICALKLPASCKLQVASCSATCPVIRHN